MAVFNFQNDGGDLTTSDPDYGTTTTHTDTAFNENGVDFTFSSNTSSSIGQLITLDVDGVFFAGSGASGKTGTLSVVDADADEQFLSDIVLDFSRYSHSTGSLGAIQVSFINTVTNNTVVKTLPGNNFQEDVTMTAGAGLEFNVIRFTLPDGFDQLGLHEITATPSCFTENTLITTPTGDVAVQDLRKGDLVCTADGGTTKVKWLGTQFIDTRMTRPEFVNPIRITAGALGNGVPTRDLSLSGDHAVAIDDVLYNAGALVNGTTIYMERQTPKAGFTYYHVETDGHELLLAEGVAAESYIDYARQGGFDNDAARDQAVISEMDMPRISSARFVPAELQARLRGAEAASAA